MNTVIINGNKIEVPDGTSISVVNGDVIIGGNQVGTAINNEIKIKVEGTLTSLKVDRGSVECDDVHGNVDAGSNVVCKNVGGSVDAGSNVQCGDVGGDIEAGSNVTCGKVSGDIDAGGNVISRK